MPTVSIQQWNEFITACPQAHVLQSPAWGELKSQFGWEVCRVIHGKLGAQVLFQRVPFGISGSLSAPRPYFIRS